MDLENISQTKHKELLALVNPLIKFMHENNFNYFLVAGKDGTCTRHLRGSAVEVEGMITGMMENHQQVREIFEYCVTEMKK